MKDFFKKLFGQKLINYFHLCQAILANFIYGFPSQKLKVVGVTGTDGKTTTVNLIASVLQAGGRRTSFLSTINAQIGDKIFDTGLHTTTPSPFLLQKLLWQMMAAGSEFAVLEVTSHALDQYRTWGIKFDTAVLTNITPEHLDYHKTLEKYAGAKMKMFEEAEYRISNFEYKDLVKWNKVMTYGFNPKAQFWADNIKGDLKSTSFQVHIRDASFEIRSKLPGKFNVLNALAAISVGQLYQIPNDKIVAGLAAVKQISGRMEYIDEGQDFLAMIDFAHTPNALRALTTFSRPRISGQLILVFGCAGERDPFKRAEMGKVADEFADLIVITREDNRSEDVNKICEQIASGIKQKKINQGYFIIPDRREAIRFALSKAGKNDIVIVTGKGHEQSLNVDGVETSWDDRKVLREEIHSLLSFRI